MQYKLCLNVCTTLHASPNYDFYISILNCNLTFAEMYITSSNNYSLYKHSEMHFNLCWNVRHYVPPLEITEFTIDITLRNTSYVYL
jgi:hypothetical protein